MYLPSVKRWRGRSGPGHVNCVGNWGGVVPRRRMKEHKRPARSPPCHKFCLVLLECGCLCVGERRECLELCGESSRRDVALGEEFAHIERRRQCLPQLGELASGATMPIGKPIYLKTPLSKRGRKVRLRDILTPDMISPPMGELRHLAHIGRAGKADMFGDLTFLQGHFDLVPEFRGRLSTASEGSVDGRETDPSADQPVLKTTVSLPALIEPQLSPREHEEHSRSVCVVSKEELMLAPPKPPRLYLDQNVDEDDALPDRSTVDTGEAGAAIDCESGLHAESQGLASFPMNGTIDSSQQASCGTSVSNGHTVGSEQLFESQASEVESEWPKKDVVLRSSGYGHVANGGLTNGLGFSLEAHRNTEAASRVDQQQTSSRASQGHAGNVRALVTSATNHKDGQEVTKPRSGSLISLQLDLGPSMLEDILSVMEDTKEDPSSHRQRPKTYIM